MAMKFNRWNEFIDAEGTGQPIKPCRNFQMHLSSQHISGLARFGHVFCKDDHYTCIP